MLSTSRNGDLVLVAQRTHENAERGQEPEKHDDQNAGMDDEARQADAAEAFDDIHLSGPPSHDLPGGCSRS